jgi:hypothetical protein
MIKKIFFTAFIAVLIMMPGMLGCFPADDDDDDKNRPVADAGVDQYGVENASRVELDGTRSFDPNGRPLLYIWAQKSGCSVSLSDVGSSRPHFTMPEMGYLKFHLKVDNGKTASLPDYVTISTFPKPPAGNKKPTADAGPDQSEVTGQVTLDGTGSFDPDNDALLYHWFQEEGPEITLDNVHSPNPVFDSQGNSSYTFSLIVYDGGFGSEPDKVFITTGSIAGTLSVAGTVRDIVSENGLADVTCTLKFDNGDVVGSDKTSSSGAYKVTGLDPGTFKVYYSKSNCYEHYAGKVTLGGTNVTGLDVGLISDAFELDFINDVLRDHNMGICKWEEAPKWYLCNVPAGAVTAAVKQEITDTVGNFTHEFVSSPTIQSGDNAASDVPGYEISTGTAPGWVIVEFTGQTTPAAYICTTEGSYAIDGGLVKINQNTMSKNRKSLFCKVMIFGGTTTVNPTNTLFADPVIVLNPSDLDLVLGKIVYGTYGRPPGNTTPDDNPVNHDITP